MPDHPHYLQDKATTEVNTRTSTATNTATIKQWVTEMAKGDLDRAPYAEDAEVSDPIGKYKGKAQIHQSFKVSSST